MRSPHNAAARWALHDVAAAIAGWVTETDGFAEWRARDDWAPQEASIIERIGMALANLDLRQVGMIRAAVKEQRRADAMGEV